MVCVPCRSGCSLVLSLIIIYLCCFSALFPLRSPLSHEGQGQPAMPISSTGTHLHAIR